MSDQTHLVCVLVSEMTGEPVAGSVPSTCAICTEPIWISASGCKLMRDRDGIKPVCVACGMAHAESEDDSHFAVVPGASADLTPGQAQDVRKMIVGLNTRAERRRAARRRRG